MDCGAQHCGRRRQLLTPSPPSWASPSVHSPQTCSVNTHHQSLCGPWERGSRNIPFSALQKGSEMGSDSAQATQRGRARCALPPSCAPQSRGRQEGSGRPEQAETPPPWEAELRAWPPGWSHLGGGSGVHAKSCPALLRWGCARGSLGLALGEEGPASLCLQLPSSLREPGVAEGGGRVPRFPRPSPASATTWRLASGVQRVPGAEAAPGPAFQSWGAHNLWRPGLSRAP